MEYMTKKEYEEKKVVLEKEERKYDKRGLRSLAVVAGSVIAALTLANVPLKIVGGLSAFGFGAYTFYTLSKRNSAGVKLRELKEQRLSELEQRIEEE